jgi:HAL2 family 3'(2'),5'-bisphosphate nucleotidase
MNFQKYDQELATALQAVREAARVCRHVQAAIGPGVMEKQDRSPVTIADFASQAVICRTLDATFSNDPIIGEEDSAELSQSKNEPLVDRIADVLQHFETGIERPDIFRWIDRGSSQSAADRFWTLDPIDGTKGFLRGGQYAISLAMLVESRIEVAVVGCPNLTIQTQQGEKTGVIFFAVRGEGAWAIPQDGNAEPTQVRVSETTESSLARFCESVESGHTAHEISSQVAERLNITAPPIRMDSQAKYAAVARGEADIYMRLPTRPDYREKIWDHAGGCLVVEEAGGRVTDVFGKPLDWSHGHELSANRGVIVTNGHLHDRVIETLAELEVS